MIYVCKNKDFAEIRKMFYYKVLSIAAIYSL